MTLCPPPPPRRYDWVTSYKVQFSNDTHTWQPCRNGTEEAVRAPSSARPARRGSAG